MHHLQMLLSHEEVKQENEEVVEMTPPPAPTTPMPSCNVCGGPDAAFHYNGLVCQ